MKSRLNLKIVAWLSLALWAAVGQALPVVRVGMVVDGPWRGNSPVREATVRELQTLAEGEFDIRFPASAYLAGDWTLESVQAHLQQLFDDPEVDVVIAWGVLASHALCCFAELPKPAVAPVILDYELQGLPYRDGVSAVRNLSYVALPDNLRNEILLFREVVPFDHVAFVGSRAVLDSVPGLALRALEMFQGLGLGVQYIAVDGSVEDALAAITDPVDAVYVLPLLHLSPEQNRQLVAGLNQRQLPTFSALGGEDLEIGMLASAGAEGFFDRLARRVALNVQRILLGEEAGQIPVAFAVRDELRINMATARQIGVSPRWEVLLEAELLYDDTGQRTEIDLGTVVQQAIAANLDLAAERQGLAVGAQDVARARANFRPRVEVSTTAVEIDRDRAQASFGSQPQRALTGRLSLTQLIYSDDAAANLTVQKELQLGREEALEALRLDIAQEAATVYLNLLRAQTLLQVQRNNLELTRTNLELARLRRSIGTSGPAEVYRWESQIANDRQALVNASRDLHQTEIALAQLLHRDLEERFATVEVGLDDASLITGEKRFRGYIETPRVFRVLRDFSVREGLEAAPELRRLRASIAAQERLAKAARRAFWAPAVSASAGLDEVLAEGGAGSGVATATDDTSWNLALVASLPLFLGGQLRADRLAAEEQLTQLEVQYRAAAEKIEQRIRSGSIAARASFTGIDLAQRSAAAAGRNLELVADSYARGAVSILDLLDAQNAALNADLRAANALYDFFVDLMEVQRASSQFDFFTSPGMREAWYERLDQFFAEAGVEPFRPSSIEEPGN